jgi:phosphoribosylanthranilate isomerase
MRTIENPAPLMTVWIKICGMTSEDAVRAAAAAGADAIGFVFAPSKRQVSAQRAAELARLSPSHVMRVAVMHHPSQELLDEVWRIMRPDVLQTDAEDLVALRLPAELAVVPVLRAGRAVPEQMPPRVLFEGPVSGSGETADWSAAARLAKRTQMILAGGLNASNVASAIARVQPFGVDVSSGVEKAPGMKDPALIREFVETARSAGSVGTRHGVSRAQVE